jgi:hypothetical protein
MNSSIVYIYIYIYVAVVNPSATFLASRKSTKNPCFVKKKKK